jgi:hypothetical protein
MWFLLVACGGKSSQPVAAPAAEAPASEQPSERPVAPEANEPSSEAEVEVIFHLANGGCEAPGNVRLSNFNGEMALGVIVVPGQTYRVSCYRGTATATPPVLHPSACLPEEAKRGFDTCYSLTP